MTGPSFGILWAPLGRTSLKKTLSIKLNNQSDKSYANVWIKGCFFCIYLLFLTTILKVIRGERRKEKEKEKDYIFGE
jgi:hypothetical protein